MEAALINGVVSIILLLLKNLFDSKKSNSKILTSIKEIENQQKNQTLDILRLKMDKFVSLHKKY